MGVAALTQNRRRSIIRTVAVIALGIYVTARGATQIPYYWLPQGDFGIRDVIPRGSLPIIKELVPHSAATDAGLRVGDQIETKYLSLHEYNVGCCGSFGRPGETLRLHVLHDGKERVVALVARPVHMSAASIKNDVVGQIGGLLRVALGVTLVLIRPGLLTWLFLLMLTSGGSFSNAFNLLPGWLFIAALLPYTVLIGAAPFTYVLFCLVFPKGERAGWRRRVFPFVVGALAVASAIELVRFAGLTLKLDTTATDWIPNVEDIIGGVLGVAALLAYYFESRGLDRERVRWILVIMTIGMGTEIAWNLLTLLSPATIPQWWNLVWYWGFLLPIVFAYAIIRYQMFDVEFVLSRALVYSLLAIAAIGIFLAIDFAFTSRFHGSKAELAVDIAVALGIGFWVRAIHGRAIDLVDRALFRRRYESRMRLKATFGMLAAVDSKRTIEEIMTSSAASALGLASAVFFRRVADGGFLREIGFGWPTDALWHLLPDDKVVTALEKNAPPSIDLQSVGWSRAVAAPPQQPAFAVPMQTRRRVIGVTFYGSRLNGVLPSPDEVSGLIELSRRAADAYLILDSSRFMVGPRELAQARALP